MGRRVISYSLVSTPVCYSKKLVPLIGLDRRRLGLETVSKRTNVLSWSYLGVRPFCLVKTRDVFTARCYAEGQSAVMRQ